MSNKVYTLSGFTYDFGTNVITVSSSLTSITVQQIVNITRVAETSFYGMESPQIIDAAGKDNLGNNVAIGITCTLLDNWVLKFADFGGPNWVQRFIVDGNLVGGIDNNPLTTSTFVQTVILRSAAGTISTVSSNNGTPTEIAAAVWINSGTASMNNITLTGVSANVDYVKAASAVWNYNTSTFTSDMPEVFGGMLKNIFVFDNGKWEIKNNKLTIYRLDGTTILKEFNLYDENDNPTSTKVIKRIPI